MISGIWCMLCGCWRVAIRLDIPDNIYFIPTDIDILIYSCCIVLYWYMYDRESYILGIVLGMCVDRCPMDIEIHMCYLYWSWLDNSWFHIRDIMIWIYTPGNPTYT